MGLLLRHLARLHRHWHRSALAFPFAAGIIGTACAQAPATTITVTPEASQTAVAGGGVPLTTILETVEVWLGDYGIMLWTPQVDLAGGYHFQVTNAGQEPHDLAIVRWPGDIDDLPSRSGRVLLQGLNVIARSPVLDPEESFLMEADLSERGTYVLLSGHGTDFGRGMITTIRVGGGSAMPAPQATPEEQDDSTVAVYLLDNTILTSRSDADDGEVRLAIQNLGPSPHDAVVVQWRGAADALPVDSSGELLMDSLIVLGHVPPLEAGGTAELFIEFDPDFAYMVLSSLPGDYAAGLGARIETR